MAESVQSPYLNTTNRDILLTLLTDIDIDRPVAANAPSAPSASKNGKPAGGINDLMNENRHDSVNQ